MAKINYEPGTVETRKNEIKNIIQMNPLGGMTGQALSDNLKFIQETDKIFSLEKGKGYNKFNNFANLLADKDRLSKKEWLEYRQKGIGGSDISAIVGINPWKSALAVYYEKTEKVPELEAENLPAELGLFLEPFLSIKLEKWLLENEGVERSVWKESYILQHPTNPIALANLDGYLLSSPTDVYAIVEFKTTSERNYLQWKDENLPSQYYLQIQWYLYVTNCKKCYLAFLIGNNKFNVTIIERNNEVIEQMVEKANYFWKNFIEKKVPPAPSGDDSSKEILDKMYKAEEGKEIILENKLVDSVKTILDLKKKVTEMTQEIESNQQLIKAEMGTATLAHCGDYVITWKETSKKEYLCKATTYRVLRIKREK